MIEVCEFIQYESYYEEDVVIEYNHSYSQLWIIIDGSVTVEINVKNEHFHAKDIVAFAKEFGHDGRTLLH